jgi:hypothetical protein
MKISTLIEKLQRVQTEHGDLHVSGAFVTGHPEMSISSVQYTKAGALVTAASENDEDDLPERVLIEWKVA